MRTDNLEDEDGRIVGDAIDKMMNDPSYTMTDEEDIYDGTDGTGA